MKNNNFYDVDSENLEIAEKILDDSENINTDDVYDEELLNSFKNVECKKKRKITKFIAISASAAAVCLIFMNSMGMLNLMGINEKGSSSEVRDESNIVYEYSEIYERMKYAGDMNDYLARYSDTENFAHDIIMEDEMIGSSSSDNAKGSSNKEGYTGGDLGFTQELTGDISKQKKKKIFMIPMSR